MELINFTIVNKNINLNVITHTTNYTPKFVVIHLHGLYSTFQPTSENTDEFQERIKYLSRGKIVSYALEFNGHGKSDGKKGIIDDYNDMVSDLDSLVSYVSKYHNNIPIYILGESLGGSIGIKYCILNKEKINGLILLAPLCGLKEEQKPSQYLIRTLQNISYLFPTLSYSSNNDEKCYSNNDYLEALKNNKYHYNGNINLGTARELLKISTWIEENSENLETPLFLFHDINDPLLDFEISKTFFNKCSSRNKILLEITDNKHALLVQNDKDDIMPMVYLETITNWILKNNKPLLRTINL